MSNLILDIGNTRTKAAVTDGGRIVEMYTADNPDQLELDKFCILHGVVAAVASVVNCQPDFGRLLPPRVFARFHQLGPHSRLPIVIDYETPHTLGMDRIAAVVGAREECPDGPLLVVDAGTCITVDLLDGDNRFLGGAILPGIAMRLRAMHQFTAALPQVVLSPDERDGSLPTPMTGRTTRASLVAGACNASLFEIQGFAEAYSKQFPGIKLFLTGGDADFFAKRLFFPNFATPNLIVTGLDKILRMNVI